MKLNSTYSHHNGVDLWHDRDLYEWATDIFEAPKIKVGEVSTTVIRDHVKSELEADGWAFNVRIDAEVDLSVFARKGDLAFQLQTGNISRYAYDLLKLQHLYAKREIESAILAVPTKEAAIKIGSNIANSERIWNELNIFDRFITLPIMLITFE
ncbi:restriction endonuclease [Ruegeria sp. HKCCC1038]|uniref:restriction endonuclease n=1 Tax=Ruegeria sp. HKCCC1038 TaxID=2682982 RepID=UPI001488F198|nr:restriction endonuclease [Ruegeria sp. HKCCC1038]